MAGGIGGNGSVKWRFVHQDEKGSPMLKGWT
jgi:hypothetical protein